MTIETKDFVVTINDTPEMRDVLFTRVVEFFTKHEVFSGESVVQADAPILDAPDFLAMLVDDVLKPQVEWKY